MFGINLYAIIGVVFVVMILGFTGYFYWSQAKIEKQGKEILAYEITVQSQQTALEQLGVDVETIKTINKELAEIERDSAAASAALADTLRKLENTANARPTLVERLINNASRDRNRCFELATGATPLETDRDNRVCPQLVEEN